MLKRKLAFIVSIGLLLGTLFSCGSGDKGGEVNTQIEKISGSGEDTRMQGTGSKEEGYHAVVAYLVGNDTAPDIDLVEEEFNNLTKEQLNMTVELMPLSYGTFKNQTQLMLASGEAIDIVPIGSDHASTYVASDYLINMDDYIQEYGQDIISIVGEETVNTCKSGDFMWGIPVMKERYSPMALLCRTDILQECDIDPSGIESFDQLTDVFAKVHEAHPEMDVFGGTFAMAGNLNDLDTLSDRFGVLENMGQDSTITNYYDSDYYKEVVKLTREWYLTGYIMKDMATNQDSGQSLIKAGNLFSCATYFKPNTRQEAMQSTGYDITVLQLEKGLLRTSGSNGISYGIASGSKDPTKAMELLNWIYKTKEANDLLNWGVEGIHWVETPEGMADYPEGVTADNCGYHQSFGWAQPNQFNSHVWAGNDTDLWEQYEKFNKSAQVSVAYGFTPDLTSCTNELSALQQVIAKYDKQLACGAADPETALPEFNQALYDAGLQKVMDVKQEQLDTWLNEHH